MCVKQYQLYSFFFSLSLSHTHTFSLFFHQVDDNKDVIVQVGSRQVPVGVLANTVDGQGQQISALSTLAQTLAVEASVSTRISSLAASTQASLNTKADSASVFTQAQINSLLAPLAMEASVSSRVAALASISSVTSAITSLNSTLTSSLVLKASIDALNNATAVRPTNDTVAAMISTAESRIRRDVSADLSSMKTQLDSITSLVNRTANNALNATVVTGSLSTIMQLVQQQVALSAINNNIDCSSHIKWASFDGRTGNVYSSFGVSFVERVSAGYYIVHWLDPYPSNRYAVVGLSNFLSSNGAVFGESQIC